MIIDATPFKKLMARWLWETILQNIVESSMVNLASVKKINYFVFDI